MDENEKEIAGIEVPRPPLLAAACAVVPTETSEKSDSGNVLPFPATPEPEHKS